MGAYVTILRIVHILGAMTWVGGVFFTTFMLGPTIGALGPEGGKVMGHLVNKMRLTAYLSVAGGLTVLAGILLYERQLDLFGGMGSYLDTTHGVFISIGAIAGIAAIIVGGAVTGRTAKELTDLGGQIAAAGGPPKPEQAALMAQLQDRMRKGSLTVSLLMAVAVITMAAAQSI